MPVQGGLSIERMCQLAEVSRVGFYRYLRAGWPAEEEVDLRSAIQDVVLEHRWRYGYRRVTAEFSSEKQIPRNCWKHLKARVKEGIVGTRARACKTGALPAELHAHMQPYEAKAFG